MWRRLGCVGLVLQLMGCASMGTLLEAPLSWVGLKNAQTGSMSISPEISAGDLKAHVEILSSDAYLGRLPGGEGERLTLDYLEQQMRLVGAALLQGSYRQVVPLVGLVAEADIGMEVAGRPLTLRQPQDVVLATERVEPLIRIRSAPVVFVGYGIQAPEYGWDDYKGRDVRGKTVLMLVGDPPLPAPGQTDRLDPLRFKGAAMTYYGRWTYKYEIASRLGAAAVLVIHDEAAAGYPWGVVANHAGREHFTLDAADGNRQRVPVQGWIRDTAVSRLFAGAELDFGMARRAAATEDFQPMDLPARASMQVRNQIRQVRSANLVAQVRGTLRPDEWLIYTAHWDHLGRDESLVGDQIFNGAIDNASGVAGLLELAAAFAARPAPRSVLFVATTAEEQGLLGARHYVAQPLVPLERSLAVINMDSLNVWGETRDLVVIGAGQNSLEDELSRQAQAHGRQLRPEPEPEKGLYFRSDHFEFARRGVPGLFTSGGIDFVGQQAGFGLSTRQDYVRNHYHQVSDEYGPAWDLAGAVQDLRLLEATGRSVASNPQWPQWKAGSEFENLRVTHRHP